MSARVRHGDPDHTVLGGGVRLLLKVWVGRTWIPPRWSHLFGTWADSLVMAGVFDKGDEFPFVLLQV